MLKRSLFVLLLLAAGAALGVLLTGWLESRSIVPSVEAANATQAPLAAEPRQETAPPATNGGLRLGVVNLKRCFDENNYEFAKDVTNELKKLEVEIDQGLATLEKEMRDLKDQIDGLPKGHPLQQEKFRKMKLLETQYRVDKEMGRARFINEYSRLKLEVYNEIRRVVDVFAQGKFDLILRVEEPQLDEDSPVSVSQQINQRVVLFSSDALDVTKDVMKLLNSEYAKRKTSKPANPDPNATPGMCPKCKILWNGENCPQCNEPMPKK
ncbi:MAG: OmpH family outer membrane protein [Planctomycetes bacterium]|nr:OmpH family outer membrane protein [Planctomycetota bacterium]